ncbi:hypothetical protein CSC80_11285 [Maribacter sp. 6B07]|uniref:hypothetical protein n=1 Tax=Maribacter sp. 6B07 TaxID=2045442 RepID=UPI000C073DB4|nr:hypothetical protein [Maribacter sp. 6B07]PHN93498.1 hypothetical protein CSC80_11285 [Maribacter sp. 6B07]
MRYLSLLLIVLLGFQANCQNLSKEEWYDVYIQSGKILQFITNAEVDKIGERLDLKDQDNFEEFKKVFTEKKVPFNSTSENVYAHPHFYLTSLENEFELIIPGVKVLEKRDGEDYERSQYYFVLKTNVIYDRIKKEVYFKNADILTDEIEIHNWWLGQWEGYMDEVRKVYKLYDFTPPPPPSPPKNLQ